MTAKFFKDSQTEPVRDERSDRGPSVALALGSDGIMAFSALPLIEFMQENSIRIDLVAATSGGALLAALWGSGFDLAAIRNLFAQAVDRKFYNDVDYSALLNMADMKLGSFHINSGLLKPHALQRTYQRIFTDTRIEDLSPETVFLGTDLLSGTGMVLDEGDLARAVYASGCTYPLMPPAKVGDRMVVGGALTAPLPVMECVKRGLDVIVALYFDAAPNPEPESFMQCMSSANRITRRAILTNQIPLCIEMHHYEIVPIVIRHPLPMDLWEVDRIPEIMHAGRVAVRETGEHILQVVGQYSPELVRRPRIAAEPEPRPSAEEKPAPAEAASAQEPRPKPRPARVKVRVKKKGEP